MQGATRPFTTVPACPRYPVAKLRDLIPEKFRNYLEHNQRIRACCRHTEEHDIEALKSHPDQPSPDIYIFHCTCGRKHRIFCVGGGDVRPVWTVR